MTIDERIATGKRPSLEFILDFYDAFLREGTLRKVAVTLGVARHTLDNRLLRFSELRIAKERAEARRASTESLKEYVFGHLSKDAKAVWEEVQFWKDSDTANEKARAILDGKSKRLRQELFVHALATNNFDVSYACRTTGVTRNCLEHWKEDPNFMALVEEIQWHKKNFFEKALLDLVQSGHPNAVIFANRTINRDRGYCEKIEIEHGGSIDLGWSIDQLELPLETRKQILEAIRLKEAKQVKEEAPLQLEEMVA
jgi:hypothetical protein